VEHLVDIQSSFLLLLRDPKSKQLSRECACLGLAACYGIATRKNDNQATQVTGADNLNTRLLQAFGQTSNFGGSAMMETQDQNVARRVQNNANAEDSNNSSSASAMLETLGLEENGSRVEEGGAAGLGEAALGAYREMASAALALDRPDVLYSLMLLSVTDAIWTTSGYRDRYNAATLLGDTSGNNIHEVRIALRPHLSKLVPRLLRACNDPNKQTREQIGALWLSLTGGGAEGRSLITEHFLSTADTLIQDASSKLWRARAGACGALSDVVVGRSWGDLGGGASKTLDDVQFADRESSAGVRLLLLWRVTMRALDDVRTNVRESGESLARSVSSLTTRLCNPDADLLPGESQAQRDASSKAATATILAWLVQYGLNQPCAEATGACISCLLGIIDVARPSTLAPVLPELIGSLTQAISGLEPAALNYLQVRAAGASGGSNDATNNQGDRLERLRLQLAQSGPISVALTKCIDMARYVPLECQHQIIPQLDTALRCGAGFATRAAAADAVTTLVSTCSEAFKFPGSTLTNPTVRLLRALYYASERERGAMARDRMTHALGSVAGIAPGSSVRGLAIKMCDKYSRATGSNDDPAARLAVAAGLRAIAVRATSQFAEGGVNDIWRRKVLPIAFLGLREDNPKIVALWSDVWEEGGAISNKSSVLGSSSKDSSSHGHTLEEKLLPYLVDSCVAALNDVSWSRRRASCAALTEMASKGILAPGPRTSSGDAPDASRAERRSNASCRAITAAVRVLRKGRIWEGKQQLANALDKMVCQWMIAPMLNSSKASHILGWDGAEGQCPWAPFLFGGSSNDLFAGDDWFLKAGKDEVEVLEDEPVQMDLDKPNEAPANVDEIMEAADGVQDMDKDGPLNEESDAIEETITGTATQEAPEQPRSVMFVGLLRLLLEQALLSNSGMAASSGVLPFKAALLQALASVLTAHRSLLPNGAVKGTEIEDDLKLSFTTVAPRFFAVVSQEGNGDGAKFPALIVARTFDCFSSVLYKNFDFDVKAEEGVSECTDMSRLCQVILDNSGTKQAAWTVRESTSRFAASLATNVNVSALRRLTTIKAFVDCSGQALNDRKFWKVRKAGLQILLSLAQRYSQPGAGHKRHFSALSGGEPQKSDDSENESRLILEALLPQKEKILKLVRKSLQDDESQVTSVATEVLNAMASWP
jgi:proteasome component ECM29